MLFGSNNKYVDQYGSSITDLIPYKLELIVYIYRECKTYSCYTLYMKSYLFF